MTLMESHGYDLQDDHPMTLRTWHCYRTADRSHTWRRVHSWFLVLFGRICHFGMTKIPTQTECIQTWGSTRDIEWLKGTERYWKVPTQHLSQGFLVCFSCDPHWVKSFSQLVTPPNTPSRTTTYTPTLSKFNMKPKNDAFQSRNLLFLPGAIFRWTMSNFPECFFSTFKLHNFTMFKQTNPWARPTTI